MSFPILRSSFSPALFSDVETRNRAAIHFCCELASEYEGETLPNPLVGSILFAPDGNEIAAYGAHKKAGSAHAEVAAIQNCLEQNRDPSKLMLACNLEPCCHHNKRTPPCAPEIIKAGIKRVVIGTLDPNPAVKGKGIEQLRRAGVDVWCLEERVDENDPLMQELRFLNRVFFHGVRSQKHPKSARPYVSCKWACDAANLFAPKPPAQHWISGGEAKAATHFLRASVDSILVGAQTARVDNPALTARDGEGKTLKRPAVFVASKTGAGLEKLHLFSSEEHSANSWIVGPSELKKNLPDFLRKRHLETDSGRGVTAILSRIFEQGQRHLFIEGGADLLGQIVEGDHWDECFRWQSSREHFTQGIPAPEMVSEERVSTYQLGSERGQRFVHPSLRGQMPASFAKTKLCLLDSFERWATSEGYAIAQKEKPSSSNHQR